MSTDKIMINKLRISCRVGCFGYEKFAKRELIASIILNTSLQKPGITDALKDTLDYSSLQKRICDTLSGENFNLIESVAQRIADICLEFPYVSEVIIKLEKPHAIPLAESVAVEITRHQHTKRQYNESNQDC